MMGTIGKVARVLGPKGLMPNPKTGTVTPDVTKAIAEVKAGKVEYRLDKANIIHVPIGKASFDNLPLLSIISISLEILILNFSIFIIIFLPFHLFLIFDNICI